MANKYKVGSGLIIPTKKPRKMAIDTLNINNVVPMPSWLDRLIAKACDIRITAVESITPLHTKKGSW